jgi:TolB protein
MFRQISRLLLLLVCLLTVSTARAVLTIDITQGVEAGMPIAIVPFGGQGGAPEDLGQIISNNLARSGRFEPIDPKDFLSRPHDERGVQFKDWRLIKAEALVVGRIEKLGGDRYRVRFQLFDVFKGSQLAGYRYTVRGRQLRRVAHQISDIVYEKLTGEPGAFDTRIAYITVERKTGGTSRFLLQVADADGYNPITVLDSNEPIMSPAWSPDGRRLAYVSFENRRSMVYLQTLADGKRELVADYRGINSAPAWSPDGSKLALVLSRDGNPEIYVLDLRSRQLRRITEHHAIDTEPVWSPDGRRLAFTSDRSGKPQVYQVPVRGGTPERLTFEGDYNARPGFAPDGKSLSLVTGEKGRFHIGILQLANKSLQVLTQSTLDESPSFAPNGRMVLYATEEANQGVLAAVSSDGRVRQRLRFLQGDVREPAWSPFNRKF